jgi:membrane-associated phospholipid phosphatase
MTAESASVGADHRFARTVTEAFAPAVLAAAMVVVFALSGAGSLRAGVGWALLAALFTAAVPYAIVWTGVRRGHLTDHHIGVREQRRTPLLLGLVSCLAGIGVLAVLGAPRPLTAMVVVLFTTGVVITGVNQLWKLSAHAAVAAASAETLVIAFGQWMTPLFVVVALVAWSRVRLGAHSPAHVVAGAIAGVALSPPVYVLVAEM